MLYSATSVIMPELDLVGQAEILSKYGYDGIELRVRNCSDQARSEAKPSFWGYHVNDITPANFKKKAPEIRKVLKDHGLKMAGIAAAVLCNDIEQFKLLLDGAVKTKAPWIRVGASRPYYDGDNYYEILGVKVPLNTIPVTPGRNLAVILEVAAMNNRQRRMGYNAAQEFTAQINKHLMQSL